MAEISYKGRGINNIRKLLNFFEVTGPHGKHAVLVFEPAQMSLRDMRFVFRREGFEEEFVQGAIIELLKALDFLHSHGEIVHTGIVLPGDRGPRFQVPPLILSRRTLRQHAAWPLRQ